MIIGRTLSRDTMEQELGGDLLAMRVGLPIHEIGDWCTEILATHELECPFTPTGHHRWDTITHVAARMSVWGIPSISYEVDGRNYPRPDHLCPGDLIVTLILWEPFSCLSWQSTPPPR